jgi:DNA-binding CsgD family transcriptional regulator
LEEGMGVRLAASRQAISDGSTPAGSKNGFQTLGDLLTPSELRVLLVIVEVGGVPEVAAALGVAVTTVKTHLRRLFEKTGATRQADLVKLVAGYATPLTA